MNREPVDSALFAAFLALPAEQKDNLRWHLERGTPIHCGPESFHEFVSGDGKG